MNRIDEYNTLLNELDHTPPVLDHAIDHAVTRLHTAKRMRRLIVYPLTSVIAFVTAFVIMVNLSVPFAVACGRFPLLRDLASAVSFSPSLRAAVENEYVQPINLQQTNNDITMRVEYLIIDQKQLNIFYVLDSPVYTQMDIIPSISAYDGTALEGYAISHSSYGLANGDLRTVTIDFVQTAIPEQLKLAFEVYNKGTDTADAPVQRVDDIFSGDIPPEPETISRFVFDLTFDPTYTSQGEQLAIDQTFTIDNQTFTVTSVEIYPTHMQIKLRDKQQNSVWIKSLSYYIEDEKGNRFDKIANGISATGAIDSPMMESHRLESSFFAKSRHLTLYIEEAEFLNKDMGRTYVDLANGTADNLPQGVSLESVIRKGDHWQLAFAAIERKENYFHQIFANTYYDEYENEYFYNSSSSTTHNFWDEQNQQEIDTGVYLVQFALVDYPYDVVYLSPYYSHTVHLDDPVIIKLK